MTKPIFANTMHQIIVNDYLNLMMSFANNSEIIKSYKLLLDNSLELLVRDLKDIEYNNE